MTIAMLELADGRRLPYRVTISPRSRSVRLRLSARSGLVVVAPRGINRADLDAIVQGKRDWVTRHLKRFEEARHSLAAQASMVPPQAIDLPALNESWQIEYRQTSSKTIPVRIDRPHRLIVSGAIEDKATCRIVLHRWLARRGRETLVPWLAQLAEETGLQFSAVRIRGQRTRWGSCTAKRVINLNYKLLFLPPEWVRYVLIHELCHTRELNHSERFWRLVHRWEPNAAEIRGHLREAWKWLPGWLDPGWPDGG
ncbi:MAG TPA: SprT family zinc-dependent metalloprotease [Candidatus Competibacter sp.]|nr:SprT family zinc-dependent metalloprotease [Candidatus Competibacter sp.]